MKYCPTCETRYDEDILRFCMKDGTPLLDEEEPNFIEMPSESLAGEADDDEGDVTVVRRNIPVPPPPSMDDDFSDVRPHDSGQRIVVPTFEERQEVRARVIPPYQAPPQRSNTALTVLLTIVGTLAVVAIGLLGFYLLQSEPAANANTNININANVANMNVNTNVGLDTNFNFNLNANFNTNTNVNANANLRTPTPTPTPRPSPSITPSPTPDDEDETPTPTPARTPGPTPTPIIIRPGASPSPRVTPRATRTPTDQF